MARRPLSLSQRLQALIDQFQPIIRDVFYEAIADIKDNVIIAELVEALRIGDVTHAIHSLGLSDAVFHPLMAAIETAFETGGITTVKTFPPLRNPQTGVRAVFRFDTRDSRAEAWLKQESATLVKSVTDDTITGLQNKLFAGVRDGINPKNTALDIVGRINPATGRREGGIIGLNSQQQKWVNNASAELASPDTAANWFTRERRDKRFDSVVQKSIDTGVPLEAETITKLTTRYSDSLLQLRGETIARSESIAALNQSSQEALMQAVDTGSIKQNAIKRIWDSAGDNRVREDHRDMDGQTVGLDQPFTAPDGSKLMFPGDRSLGASADETINCRCRVRTKIDWFANAGADPEE